MATLHTIKAHLYNNALTEDHNDYVARVSAERSLSIKDICESAATRGGADVSASATGAYKVEVATQYTQGNLLKEPCTVTFDRVLTVQ
ncbi:hypothetical protein FACS189467_6680 [Bacteroidia bacterium]|nr:hypothetical protein FACS189467_6680 [Bacteroidia bacterium]